MYLFSWKVNEFQSSWKLDSEEAKEDKINFSFKKWCDHYLFDVNVGKLSMLAHLLLQLLILYVTICV